MFCVQGWLAAVAASFFIWLVLFLYVMADTPKTIEWESDRICHYVLGKINDMRMNISKMFLEGVIGEDLGEEHTIKVNTIKYNNNAVEGLFPGYPSTISVDGTIALMMNYGDFPIPEEVRKYLVDVFENNLIKDESFPVSDDKFENGRAILEAFLESGMPYYSACAITGATFVECGWNVHVYNESEHGGDGVKDTGNWAGCGEGLFGLTFWSQKEKIIKKLGFDKTDGIPNNASDYNSSRKHLCDLDEEQWIEIAKEYLENTAKKDFDVLANEDQPQSDSDLIEILSASYLWKAACGLEPTFDNVKETTKKYQNTHKNMFGEDSVHDGFGTQVLISVALDKYLHGETTIDMNDLGIDISYEISTSGKVDENTKPKPNSFNKKYGSTASSQSQSGTGVKPKPKYGSEKDDKLILPEGFDPRKSTAKQITLEVKRGKEFVHNGVRAVYGKLYVNGQYWCDTAERKLVSPGIYKVAWRADQGCTAIGRNDWISKGERGDSNYRFAIYSNKYVPLILGIKGRSGIRIHEGTSVAWSEGCLVLGKMTGNGDIKSHLTNTWESWKSLYDYCLGCESCQIVYYPSNQNGLQNEQNNETTLT